MKRVIDGVFRGTLKTLGPKASPTGIFKEPVKGPVAVGSEGLSGDHQGDRRVHGGPEKAIHLYPSVHYASWVTEYPHLESQMQPGSFGENISVGCMDEGDVCLGDRFRLGTAVVEFSQGRQPCWKLNARFLEPRLAKAVQDTGRTGWYFRVIEPGTVSAGDALELVERPHGSWSLARVTRLFYVDQLNYDALEELAAIASLAESWRKLACRRLERREVEDWNRRLNGEA
ncbi:MOSC domain-containing protein [Nitratireductor basaltis]|uniref:MOSC domain-containing protein n=1 Tax=Nitratireductor basaltis TaxID=472175 RepID=A0A084UAB2_9HYPH|nr:MOSC domain-containing protein [Nitratireductor basaltis]KFB09898.1 MOSC domain-containing protein [Nitratireductor basaltis]